MGEGERRMDIWGRDSEIMGVEEEKLQSTSVARGGRSGKQTNTQTGGGGM